MYTLTQNENNVLILLNEHDSVEKPQGRSPVIGSQYLHIYIELVSFNFPWFSRK